MTQDTGKAAELEHRPPASVRRRELLAFLVLAFGIWPIVAVGVVGGYGFLVWMWQIVFGPPGPPPHPLH
ncbi:periplasmic nitrate reductase, NapE protein [Pseudaminobacter sp. 19-2017]|uniref:Periplasmic nitrate reductase, NapE protein n=1 Tax=Pseudaminobacter soli (ex Zhang et al. 2022) TaxID=2831468 RepID=A0A942IC52_9HYPH|nr:periplasmic nitrate reductase, NapE protein [Pseudaminobacter soli]MBS3652326.1 periplasmic nitrate reductase, NapE protein [Pseudaminobacter soli]